MYVHYYFIVVALVGGLLILHERRSRQALGRATTAHSLMALLCLPLFWLIQSDLNLQAGPEYFSQPRFSLPALGYTYVSMVTGYTLGPSLRELHTMTVAEALAGFLPWLALMTPAVAILCYHGYRVLDRPAAYRLVLLTTAPVLITGILGLVAGVGYNVRYVSWVAIAAAILLAAGATRWRRWPVAVALATLLGVFGTALRQSPVLRPLSKRGHAGSGDISQPRIR